MKNNPASIPSPASELPRDHSKNRKIEVLPPLYICRQARRQNLSPALSPAQFNDVPVLNQPVNDIEPTKDQVHNRPPDAMP